MTPSISSKKIITPAWQVLTEFNQKEVWYFEEAEEEGLKEVGEEVGGITGRFWKRWK